MHACIGEGNGNPLHCSCLENLRDGEAWWAAIYGVAQSQTQLKWLSSSCSSSLLVISWNDGLLLFHFLNCFHGGMLVTLGSRSRWKKAVECIRLFAYGIPSTLNVCFCVWFGSNRWMDKEVVVHIYNQILHACLCVSVCVCVCLLSPSVTSDSLWPHGP